MTTSERLASPPRPVAPRRWRRSFASAASLAAAALLFLAGSSEAQTTPAPPATWKATLKGQYGKMTRDALERLLAASDKLQTGDRVAAKALLEGMKQPLTELSSASAYFREQANREFDRCKGHIGALDTKVGELFKQEQELKTNIDDIDAKLIKLDKQKALTEQEMTNVRKSAEMAQRKMQERQAKLRELEKWWWVPFYGAYLGIRTLVDDDIGQYNSLRNTLVDASVRLSHQQNALNAANELRGNLNKELSLMERTHRALTQLRSESEADLGNLKDTAVFLTDAQVFWGRVDNLLRTDLSQTVTAANDINNIKLLLNKQTSAPLAGSTDAQPLVDLYQSMITFSDTLDQGSNFLLAEGSAFCGGPARSRTGPPVSHNCNIEQFTKYYEIIDPKTCSFRYLNPPGCPPRPKTVAIDNNAVAAARDKGPWARAPAQNWTGKARCNTRDAIFYGKMNSIDQCEHTCMSDPVCVSWTYNTNNGYMGMDTVRECWGATKQVVPYKSPWQGFQSGGVASR